MFWFFTVTESLKIEMQAPGGVLQNNFTINFSKFYCKIFLIGAMFELSSWLRRLFAYNFINWSSPSRAFFPGEKAQLNSPQYLGGASSKIIYLCETIKNNNTGALHKKVMIREFFTTQSNIYDEVFFFDWFLNKSLITMSRFRWHSSIKHVLQKSFYDAYGF